MFPTEEFPELIATAAGPILAERLKGRVRFMREADPVSSDFYAPFFCSRKFPGLAALEWCPCTRARA